MNLVLLNSSVFGGQSDSFIVDADKWSDCLTALLDDVFYSPVPNTINNSAFYG